MARNYQSVSEHLGRLLSKCTAGDVIRRLEPKRSTLPRRIPGGAVISPPALERRWKLIQASEDDKTCLLDAQTLALMGHFSRNVENFIGTVKVPVGLAGPLRVNGLHAQGDYYVPLATTEAALVASYSRGAQLITEAGGCSVSLLSEGVSRAPGFAFENLAAAGSFVAWCSTQMEQFRHYAQSTTKHGKLTNMQVSIEGNHVYLIFEYITGDAAGQNMVTIATEAICRYIVDHCPTKPRYYFIEANLSGDKKASTQSFQGVRGKKVTAEIKLSPELIHKHLHTTPQHMIDYWNMSAIGGVLSGTIGVHGHYANGLAALYIATGQDVACVAESAVGVTRLEITSDHHLYAAVTLPNLIVGTVGGGTHLPSQQACLRLMGLAGTGRSQALAEVCAALALAGELSIKGAICSHHFTRAHERLARGRLRNGSGRNACVVSDQ